MAKYVKIEIEGRKDVLKRLEENYFWMEFDFDPKSKTLVTTYSFGKVSEFIELLESEEDIECLEIKLSFM